MGSIWFVMPPDSTIFCRVFYFDHLQLLKKKFNKVPANYVSRYKLNFLIANGLYHSPVNVCAHSRSPPLTPAHPRSPPLTPAHSSCTCPGVDARVSMENDKSHIFLNTRSDIASHISIGTIKCM